MVDFDWRVDIKTSSDSIARMSVPTCILQMKVGIVNFLAGHRDRLLWCKTIRGAYQFSSTKTLPCEEAIQLVYRTSVVLLVAHSCLE